MPALHRDFCCRATALCLAAALPWAAGPARAQDAPVGVGPTPVPLPAPHKSLLPIVNIAPAQGWAQGAGPRAMAGLRVTALARGLDHPRWLLVLPNGDVLVAESNKPDKTRAPAPDAAPQDGQDGQGAKGVKAWVADKVMGQVMKRAGAGVQSADRITLLRDADGDGVAETRSVFLQGLHSPFGMALVGNDLYVANTDAVLRFAYTPGQTAITTPATKVVDLPAGPINHHWTKNLIASRDGRKLYVTVGSNSNVGERGMAAEQGRAAIWEVDRASGTQRVFASGLRNPNGMDWAPGSGALWTVVNERDELGNDLVPDYLTSVQDGAFYGWPYSYFGTHVDERVQPPRPDLVARAVVPDYALGSHVAALGLAFAQGRALLPALAQGAFIGEHGSWNRKPHSGYKVVFVAFDGQGRPQGLPVDVLTGFLGDDGTASGRPVGVAVDPRGALLVADDVGNTIWRVTGADTPAATNTPAAAGAAPKGR